MNMLASAEFKKTANTVTVNIDDGKCWRRNKRARAIILAPLKSLSDPFAVQYILLDCNIFGRNIKYSDWAVSKVKFQWKGTQFRGKGMPADYPPFLFHSTPVFFRKIKKACALHQFSERLRSVHGNKSKFNYTTGFNIAWELEDRVVRLLCRRRKHPANKGATLHVCENAPSPPFPPNRYASLPFSLALARAFTFFKKKKTKNKKDDRFSFARGYVPRSYTQ
jgi:hypothetical protein